jgi:hypothetical protein
MTDERLWEHASAAKYRDPRITNEQIAAVMLALKHSNRLEGFSEMDWLFAHDLCAAALFGIQTGPQRLKDFLAAGR